MPCYHPISAWQCANGEIVFYEARKFKIVRSLCLPCGRCIGCRLERARQWATRCMHEVSLWKENSFITLTYDDVHLPYRGMLDYLGEYGFQRFMKRLRKDETGKTIRFYMCGEYGEQNFRPHFHACIFNHGFNDRVICGRSEAGEDLYRSAQLEKLWPFGISVVGDVTFNSAAYIARYCVDKVNGDLATMRYGRVDKDGFYMLPPEFNRSSLKPGIGAGWIEKFESDVYPHDYVVVNGRKAKPPKYYDVVYERSNVLEMRRVKARREDAAAERMADNTDSRLRVKEEVALARVSFKKRSSI